MFRNPKVTLTTGELDRLKCNQSVVDRQLKLYQAAERLGLTTRQVRRLARGTRTLVRELPLRVIDQVEHAALAVAHAEAVVVPRESLRVDGRAWASACRPCYVMTS